MQLLFAVAGLVATTSALVLPGVDVVKRQDASAQEIASNIPPMAPIKLDDFKDTIGEPRHGKPKPGSGNRIAPDTGFADLTPKQAAEFVYGTPGDNGNMMLANMTVHAPDGRLLVSMEEFEGLTAAVDCQGDDGELSITFADKAAFEQALSQWSYINEDVNEEFILITNHDGCGPDNQRQPYTITDVDNDEEKFITKLKSVPTDWETIISAGEFELDFGEAAVPPAVQAKLMRRDIFDGKHTADFDIPVNIHQPNSPLTILDTENVDIVCSNCFVAGAFKIHGHLQTGLFLAIKELDIGVRPSGFNAALEVTTTLTLNTDLESFTNQSLTVPLVEAPIPGAGIHIPGIFTLGAVMGIDAGVNIGIEGSAQFTLGLNAQIPDDAELFLDLLDGSKSRSTGWDRATITPVHKLDELKVAINGEIFLKPRVGLKVALFSASAEASLNLKLPSIEAGASITHTPGTEVCANSNKDTGLDLGVKGSIKLDFYVGAGIGESKAEQTFPIFDFPIFSADTCVAFGNEITAPETPTIDPPVESPVVAPTPIEEIPLVSPIAIN